MVILHSAMSSLPLKKLIQPSKPISALTHPIPTTQAKLSIHFQIMNPNASSSSIHTYQVPALDSDQMCRIADQTFDRYSSNAVKRKGKGTAIVWFRNDLRILDNEALFKAWASSEAVLPVYCVDPRLFGSTYYFGFPKTGGIIHPILFLLFCFWLYYCRKTCEAPIFVGF